MKLALQKEDTSKQVVTEETKPPILRLLASRNSRPRVFRAAGGNGRGTGSCGLRPADGSGQRVFGAARPACALWSSGASVQSLAGVPGGPARGYRPDWVLGCPPRGGGGGVGWGVGVAGASPGGAPTLRAGVRRGEAQAEGGGAEPAPASLPLQHRGRARQGPRGRPATPEPPAARGPTTKEVLFIEALSRVILALALRGSRRSARDLNKTSLKA